MNITIEIPDDINQQLASIKNRNDFVLNAIKTALKVQSQAESKDSLLDNSDDFTEQETQDRLLIENSVKKHKKLLLKLAK